MTTLQPAETGQPDDLRPHGRRRRLFVLLALGATGFALTGNGVFASWRATTSLTATGMGAVATGVELVNADGTTMTSGVSDLLPGDWLYRFADLHNTGSTAQTFTGTVTGSGVLSSGTSGLTAAVDSCTVAWASNGTCPGTLTALVSTTPLASSVPVSYGSVDPGSTEHIRYTFALPSIADQATYQGASGSTTVTIVGGLLSGGNDRTRG